MVFRSPREAYHEVVEGGKKRYPDHVLVLADEWVKGGFITIEDGDIVTLRYAPVHEAKGGRMAKLSALKPRGHH